jgi:hypothetical protein
MDAGSRTNDVVPVLWGRAVIVWMLIMAAETIHGALREVFIAPVIGGLRARQVGVLIGSALIFVIAWLTSRWMGVVTRAGLLKVGAAWVALTLCFEMALGSAIGLDWNRIASDYDPARGGLMSFGLAFMLFAPLIAARLRSRSAGDAS